MRELGVHDVLPRIRTTKTVSPTDGKGRDLFIISLALATGRFHFPVICIVDNPVGLQLSTQAKSILWAEIQDLSGVHTKTYVRILAGTSEDDPEMRRMKNKLSIKRKFCSPGDRSPPSNTNKPEVRSLRASGKVVDCNYWPDRRRRRMTPAKLSNPVPYNASVPGSGT